MAAPKRTSPPGKRNGPARDLHKEARLVADAAIYGQSSTAKRHGVSEKTVYRAVKAVATDPELARLVRDLSALTEAHHRAEVARAELSWHSARHRFLSRGFDRLTELLETEPTAEGSSKTCAFIRAIADALDKGGSLDVAHGALNAGDSLAREGREASPDPSSGGGAGAYAHERAPAH